MKDLMSIFDLDIGFYAKLHPYRGNFPRLESSIQVKTVNKQLFEMLFSQSDHVVIDLMLVLHRSSHVLCKPSKGFIGLKFILVDRKATVLGKTKFP